MTIAQVGREYGLTPETLRYYERIGLLPKIGRTNGGIRNYSEHDCGRISFIKCMRGAGVSIESLIEYVRLFHEGDATIPRRKQILQKERDRIAEKILELNAMVEHLDYKIENYDRIMAPAERQLKTAD